MVDETSMPRRCWFLAAAWLVMGCSPPGSRDAGNGQGSQDATTGLDASVADSAIIDAAVVDAAVVDAALVDAALIDAAVVDAALVDAAVMDAAVVDAANVDAGIVDAAVVDAGAPDGAQPSCAGERAAHAAGAPGTGTLIVDRAVPSFSRPYDIFLPPTYRCDEPSAVVLALHGGGGNKEQFVKMACPQGDLNSDQCFSRAAARHNMVVVYANGTPASETIEALKEIRTWNAGGGDAGYTCVSAFACGQHVDEATFLRLLLQDLNAVVNVDPHRIFVTGMSNGGAMSHRAGCELSQVIAAAAPVSSGNQFAALEPCNATRPVPVLQIHGTADPCWPWMGGPGGCVEEGTMYSVVDSVEGTAERPGWARRNGCTVPPVVTELPEGAADGLTVTHWAYGGCASQGDVEVYRVNGGGHRWPQGYIRPGGQDAGLMSQDINANELMLSFFEQHSCPSCSF